MWTSFCLHEYIWSWRNGKISRCSVGPRNDQPYQIIGTVKRAKKGYELRKIIPGPLSISSTAGVRILRRFTREDFWSVQVPFSRGFRSNVSIPNFTFFFFFLVSRQSRETRQKRGNLSRRPNSMKTKCSKKCRAIKFSYSPEYMPGSA